MLNQLLVIGVLDGLLATLLMDLSSVIGIAIGLAGRSPRRTGFHLIGRWFLYLFRGKFSHDSILDSPPLRLEVPIGALVHYSIGAVLGALYFATVQRLGSGPDIWSAVTFGVATTVLSWLYLYPAWGYGWLGADARGFRLTYFSLYNHVFFGIGLAIAVNLGYPS